MKCPTLIAAIARDLEIGHAVVLQVVSIDITPREYVLDYLSHSFPTELFSDDEGNLLSRPAYDADGNPLISREAVERRDHIIEHLAALPPVQGALDQILHRFGTDLVAEVTARSRRVVRRKGEGGDRLYVEARPASANFAETAAFMDDDKRILVFSDAGGTGRSYHADLGCRNQRRRIHYLLEPGWRADTAIQGLSRSNRTNQKQPPVFRPVATDVKGEKRFLSTIARRLDTLGAITRGQRQTGGQGLFRADDNLESAYAKAALRQFYQLLHAGRIEGCSLPEFQDATGLDLLDQDGSLREELPPITQFLNRVLALRIDLQNRLFATFEALLEARIEAALAAGSYDIGVETLTAESFRVAERRTVHTHASTGAETCCYRVLRKDRNRPLPLADALSAARAAGCRLRDGHASRRAHRLLRRRRAAVEGARPRLGDHRLAPAALRADGGGSGPDAGRDLRAPSSAARQCPRRGLTARCSVISAADLARRLARDAEAVCRHYLSNGRRSGRYWIAGDTMNTLGRSLYVPAPWPSIRSRRRRQMDRCRDRRAWRPA
jgi:hypothetical protein